MVGGFRMYTVSLNGFGRMFGAPGRTPAPNDEIKSCSETVARWTRKLSSRPALTSAGVDSVTPFKLKPLCPCCADNGTAIASTSREMVQNFIIVFLLLDVDFVVGLDVERLALRAF